MSQTFTDDCYSGGMQAALSLQAFEDNFASLKSTFSGATAPLNLVAGMLWYDTTAHVLKVRNEGNTDWVTIASVVTGYKSHAITNADAHTAGNKKLFYTTAAGVITELAFGTASQVLRMNSGATAPEFATISTFKVAQGSFVRARTAASGTVNITGLGLTPKIVFLSHVYTYNDHYIHNTYGWSTASTRQMYTNIYTFYPAPAVTANSISTSVSMLLNTTSPFYSIQSGVVSAFASGQFSITWTKTHVSDLEWNDTVYYIALGE